MGFRQDAYATIWSVEDKGNYSIVRMSTSKKNKQTDKYETDFNANFVRFIGTAHQMASQLSEKSRIKISSCEVTNKYDKEKNKEYTNFLVYGFEIQDGNKTSNNSRASGKSNNGFMNIPDGIDEDLPFN